MPQSSHAEAPLWHLPDEDRRAADMSLQVAVGAGRLDLNGHDSRSQAVWAATAHADLAAATRGLLPEAAAPARPGRWTARVRTTAAAVGLCLLAVLPAVAAPVLAQDQVLRHGATVLVDRPGERVEVGGLGDATVRVGAGADGAWLDLRTLGRATVLVDHGATGVVIDVGGVNGVDVVVPDDAVLRQGRHLSRGARTCSPGVCAVSAAGADVRLHTTGALGDTDVWLASTYSAVVE